MIEERVTSREQEAVRARPVQRKQQFDRFDPVDAEAPSLDHALIA